CHRMELRQIDHQSTVIGRLSRQQMAAAANRDEESLLTRKSQRGHDILVAQGAHDHRGTSPAIEDVAQRLVLGAIGRDHIPSDAILEFSDGLRFHISVSLLRDLQSATTRPQIRLERPTLRSTLTDLIRRKDVTQPTVVRPARRDETVLNEPAPRWWVSAGMAET